jgi:MFS family permease
MWFRHQREQLGKVYAEYPRAFWTLVIVTFIDRLGGALLFPFFALYITSKFRVGMTEVGILFALFSVSSFIGVLLGGALSDRLGRKGMVIFSLISTSVSSVIMGLVNSLPAFFMLALVVGIFTDAGHPTKPWWQICYLRRSGRKALALSGLSSTSPLPLDLQLVASWPHGRIWLSS